MPRLGEDLELVLALHLADHEVLVETVGAGEEEELGAGAGEEFDAEVAEPGWPEGLGGGEGGAPGVGGGGGWWVFGGGWCGLWGEICSGHWEKEGGNGDAGREGIADCSGTNAKEVVSATCEGTEPGK